MGGTKSQFSGQLARAGECIYLTHSSTSKVTTSTKQEQGRINEGGLGEGSGSNRGTKHRIGHFCARAIGQKKLKCIKNEGHLAWREFNILAVQRYSKFLYSVHTRNGCSDPSNQWRHIDGQQLPVANIIVFFSGGQLPGEEGTWVKLAVLRVLLRQDCTDTYNSNTNCQSMLSRTNTGTDVLHSFN